MTATIDTEVVARLRAAIDAVNSDPMLGTKKGGQTSQTRWCVAAMKTLGVKRDGYSAKTERIRRRNAFGYSYHEYGDAMVNAHSREAHAAITEHAAELASAGFHVTIYGREGQYGILSTGNGGSVSRITGDKVEHTYYKQEEA